MEAMLDDTDWQLLQALQDNARLTFSELGRRVGLSSPAVAERVRRMEDAGVITGYHADVNVAKIGLPMTAIVRFNSHNPQGDLARAEEVVVRSPEVIDAYVVTGRDCMVLKVAVASIAELNAFLTRLKPYGDTETGMILSAPITNRTIRPAAKPAAVAPLTLPLRRASS